MPVHARSAERWPRQKICWACALAARSAANVRMPWMMPLQTASRSTEALSNKLMELLAAQASSGGDERMRRIDLGLSLHAHRLQHRYQLLAKTPKCLFGLPHID